MYLDLDTLGVNLNVVNHVISIAYSTAAPLRTSKIIVPSSSATLIPIFIFDVHTASLIVQYFQPEVSASTIHEVKDKRTMGSSFNAVIVVFGLISAISITVFVELMFMMSLAWIICGCKILWGLKISELKIQLSYLISNRIQHLLNHLFIQGPSSL